MTAGIFPYEDLQGTAGDARASGVLSSFTNYSDEVLADEPLGYWRHLGTHSGQGATPFAIDESGNALDLTGYHDTDIPPASDGASLLAGEADPSMEFQPGNNVWNPEHYGAFLLSGSLTIEFWYRPVETANALDRDLVRKGSEYLTRHTADGYLLGRVRQTGNFDTDVLSSSRLIGGQTHHIAMVWDRETLKLYIDGELNATQVATNPGADLVTGFGSFVINQFSSASNAGWGTYDEVALYSHTLSAARIAAHYAAGAPPLAPYVQEVRADGPLAYWQMGSAGTTQPEDAGGTALILTGATPRVAGAAAELGSAVSFDGVDDYGRVASLDLSGTDKITVEYWLKWDSYGGNDNLSLEHGETNRAKGFAHDPNAPGSTWNAFSTDQDGDLFYAVYLDRPSEGDWHHIAVSMDRGAATPVDQFSFFVDGVPRAGVHGALQDLSGTFQNYPLMVMARSAANDGSKSLHGAGDMQHLAVYDYLLPAARVAAHYAARAVPAAPAPYVQEVRADGPAAYWQMGSAGTDQPEDAGGVPLVLTGATPQVAGATPELGSAVSFDGVNDYGRVAAVDLHLTDKATVEYWLLWDSYAFDDRLSLEFGESNAPNGFAHDPNSSGGGNWAVFGKDVYYQYYEENMPRPSAGVWHHIAVVLDRSATLASGDQIRFYVDGVERPGYVANAGSDWSGNWAGPEPLMVMCRAAAGDGTKSLLGNGDMQHLAIYDYVLPADRVLAHYEARAIVAIEAPASTAAPALAGVATAGQIVSCSTGVWTGSPTGYAYQWKRAGVAIAGATVSSYLLQLADVGTLVSCTVTATNVGGSTSADSGGVTVTAPVPVESDGRHPLTIQLTDDAGNTIAGAVDIRRRDAGPVQAFADEAGETPVALPADTGADGNLTLWLEPAPYEWTASHDGDTLPWTPVDIPALIGPQGPPGGQVAQSYSVAAGFTADRSFNPAATTINEVAAVLGSLINDMKASGLIAP